MHFAKAFAAATFAFLALGLAGCGVGMEGSYLLDKGEMKKKAETEIAKLPEAQQAEGKAALQVIDRLEMTFDFQSGGALTVQATTPGLTPDAPSKIEQKNGTWQAVGETIEFTIEGKSHKCTKGQGQLTCTSDNKNDPTLVLVKGG